MIAETGEKISNQEFKSNRRWQRKDIDYQPQPIESSLVPDSTVSAEFNLQEIDIDRLPDEFKNNFKKLSDHLLLITAAVENSDLHQSAEKQIARSLIKKGTQKIEDWGENIPNQHQEIASNIRHDFKNIITQILGRVILIQEEPSNGDREVLEGLVKAKQTTLVSLRCWQAVINLLSKENVNLRPLSSELRSISKLGNKREEDILSGDPDRYKNVLVPGGILGLIALNLRLNAQSIADKNGKKPEFSLSLGVNTDENNNYQLEIKAWDKAEGFAEELFEEDKLLLGKSQRQGGTGQGLQIINNFVEAMKGTATVGNWSDPKTGETQGAYFEFHIPLKEEKQTV